MKYFFKKTFHENKVIIYFFVERKSMRIVIKRALYFFNIDGAVYRATKPLPSSLYFSIYFPQFFSSISLFFCIFFLNWGIDYIKKITR